MYDIYSLLDDLRRDKVVGRVSDPFSFNLMWHSKDTLLLRYSSTNIAFVVWMMVRRTSKQNYKVFSCVTKFDYDYTCEKSLRNIRLTTEYIKQFLK